MFVKCAKQFLFMTIDKKDMASQWCELINSFHAQGYPTRFTYLLGQTNQDRHSDTIVWELFSWYRWGMFMS